MIHGAEAFTGLFNRPTEDKPSILGILTKPKIPGLNIQLGTGSFGFNLGIGGFLPSGGGGNYPHRETVHVKPGHPWDDKKEKVGPRPNWGDEKDNGPKPGSHDYGKDDYPKPGPYDDYADYSKPGGYEEDKDYSNPGSLKDSKDYPKPEEKKDSLPDWEDIGEKDPKSESLMDRDLIGEGFIQPRLNRRRSKRYIESRVFHVPLLFRSNGKPYKVKINSHPNSLTNGKEVA